VKLCSDIIPGRTSQSGPIKKKQDQKQPGEEENRREEKIFRAVPDEEGGARTPAPPLHKEKGEQRVRKRRERGVKKERSLAGRKTGKSLSTADKVK